MKLVLSVILCLVFCCDVCSQTSLDSLQQLEEVVLRADRYLKTFSNTQSVHTLEEDKKEQSASSLTELLNNNSTIYFKENGLGMVSSPSFRGTTAQQTAVIWNGININSQFNGQTDFNTINIRGFDEISIRNGGGSVLYGSGAIGGTIHLNNNLEFDTGFKNALHTGYGSFNTLDLGYKSRFSSKKFSVDIAVGRTSSDNDYIYVDSDKSNLNGAFYNQVLSANFGYRINSKNTIKLYSYLFDGERHFSLLFPSETPTKYQDFNYRNMLEWSGVYGKVISTLKLAYIAEKYKYFANINKDSYAFGHAKTMVGKYNVSYRILTNASIQGLMDITHRSGRGTNINENERTISGFGLLFKQKLKTFLYEGTLRKEITNNYESPLLFSLGFQYKFSPHYIVKINGSKNFRIPTYNDLYWEGSGNMDLKPETSLQIEMGHKLTFKNLDVTATGFYNDITHMIRWVPAGSNWTPVNTDHVVTYGVESGANFRKQLGTHQFSLEGVYAYTVSENQKTKKKLIYVPRHKASGRLDYKLKKWGLYWQVMYTGKVFTLSDNHPEYVLDDYLINTAGAEFNLWDDRPLTIGIQVRNIFNENYQSVADRYMPGINYNFYLNFKF